MNAAGIALIKRFEGCRLAAYQDVAGIWTIGYGHTGGIHPGMRIDQDQADALLHNDVFGADQFVSHSVGVIPTTDNQHAAMVALAFNIGSGNFRASSVLRLHLSRQRAMAADAFLLWGKAHINGVLQEVAGLTNRRQAERALYLEAE